ncbi:hypothetical protein [Streptomyces sp. NPDC002962]|uniref:hypothetical protein n=1 Tax=Streptomyces sp. NPDC002962 TaxID=3364674 RepID=UPI0036B9096E
MTLVIRTNSDVRSQPQYEYHPPSLARNPFYHDPTTARRIQLLHALRDHYELFRKCLHEAVRDNDFASSVTVLLEVCKMQPKRQLVDEMIDLVVDQYGAPTKTLHRVTEELMQNLTLASLRNRVRDPAARLILALVLNGLNRKDAIAIFSERYGGDAVSRMTAAVVRLLEEGDDMRVMDPIPALLFTVLSGRPIDSCTASTGYQLRDMQEIASLLSQSLLVKKLIQA